MRNRIGGKQRRLVAAVPARTSTIASRSSNGSLGVSSSASSPWRLADLGPESLDVGTRELGQLGVLVGEDFTRLRSSRSSVQALVRPLDGVEALGVSRPSVEFADSARWRLAQLPGRTSSARASAWPESVLHGISSPWWRLLAERFHAARPCRAASALPVKNGWHAVRRLIDVNQRRGRCRWTRTCYAMRTGQVARWIIWGESRVSLHTSLPECPNGTKCGNIVPHQLGLPTPRFEVYPQDSVIAVYITSGILFRVCRWTCCKRSRCSVSSSPTDLAAGVGLWLDGAYERNSRSVPMVSEAAIPREAAATVRRQGSGEVSSVPSSDEMGASHSHSVQLATRVLRARNALIDDEISTQAYRSRMSRAPMSEFVPGDRRKIFQGILESYPASASRCCAMLSRRLRRVDEKVGKPCPARTVHGRGCPTAARSRRRNGRPAASRAVSPIIPSPR